MLSSLVLSLLFASTSTYYHSTTGQVEMVAAKDVVVLRALDSSSLTGIEALMTEASAQKVLRSDFNIREFNASKAN